MSPTQFTRPRNVDPRSLYPPDSDSPTQNYRPQDGKDGLDGKDGKDGKTGPQGPEGPQGPPPSVDDVVAALVIAIKNDTTLIALLKGEDGKPGDPADLAKLIEPYLGPVIYQPGALNSNGELVPAGQPWEAKIGGPPVILPPNKLNVRNWDGTTTVTQGPIGGGLGFEMKKPK